MILVASNSFTVCLGVICLHSCMTNTFSVLAGPSWRQKGKREPMVLQLIRTHNFKKFLVWLASARDKDYVLAQFFEELSPRTQLLDSCYIYCILVENLKSHKILEKIMTMTVTRRCSTSNARASQYAHLLLMEANFSSADKILKQVKKACRHMDTRLYS